MPSGLQAKRPDNASLGFSSDAFDNDIYSEVTRRAKLRDVRLIRSGFSIKPSLLSEEIENNEALLKEFDGSIADHNFDSESGVSLVFYNWSAAIRKGREKLLRLSGNYVILYSNLKEQRKEYVDLYVNKVARFTSYPYFRVLFSIQTGSAGLVVAPLPSLNERSD